jgi:ATP-dependent helicase HrpB
VPIVIKLPIDESLDDVRDAIARAGACVLEAPPGAGKTTRVPPMLLDIVKGDVIVLEPRRMAARMAARRVADERGEKVGETVGYAVRFEEARGPKTRLHFVTEGVLTRRLAADPTLEGVSAIVLDELHERHVHTDVALALVRRLRKGARRDLVTVAMSATLDAEPVAKFLEAPVVRSEGRVHPLTIVHEDAPDDRALELRVASAVRRALTEATSGHVLVFLPGAAEIRRAMDACASAAQKFDAVVLPLHGELPPDEQDRAVSPSTRRKVIVSTNVAESSVTIADVVAVVDSGLVRRAEHSPYTGLPSLRVEKASRASCVQRAGRAGRTREGFVYRLYARSDFESRPEQETPELLRVDLASTLLELRAGGVEDDVHWLDAPPEKAITAAKELLARLGATDARGAITDLGRAMMRMPLHPRLARVVIEAERRGVSDDGATAAALLGERDIRLATRMKPGDAFSSRRPAFGGSGDAKKSDLATDRSDVLAMMDALFEGHDVDRGAVRRVELAKKQLRRFTREPQRLSGKAAEDALLLAILAGYTDRVAKRLSGRALALSGGKAELAETSVVRDAPLMVAVDAEARGSTALVRVASEVTPEQLVEIAADRLDERTTTEWNASSERAERVTRLVYDGLAIEETRSPASGPEASALLLRAAQAKGLTALAGDSLDDLRLRVAFAHAADASIPLLEDTALEDALRECCEGRSSFAELREAGALDLVRASLPIAKIDRLAPTRITLPSGRVARVTYEPGKPPFVASRMQDFFGLRETPRAGNVPLVLHLLAPNQRAVQVTSDLAGFWERHYPKIRKELMRKYPRHAWPEDPLAVQKP